MNIFNSLGSNYDLSFAIRSLITKGDKNDLKKLSDFLSEKYQGETHLTYKGRDAIFLALKAAELPVKSLVAINGFTCYAVYKAVVDAGHVPILIDIDKDRLHFGSSGLDKKIKAVITQNTLGIPCKIEKISQFCLENDSLLIEDLAHSVGTTYDDGKTAGTVGDMVVFSFSQDKLIDAVSGGALIIRNQKFTHFSFSSFNKHSLWGIIKDRTYPANTFKIRKLYPLGLGKLLHQFFKLINILPKPVESDPHMYEMKSWQAQLALFQFQDLNKNMQHRKSIAKIYAKELDDKITNKTINNLVNQSSCLRFPIFAEKRSRLISFLKQHGIYVSDIWYDAPISPKRYMKEIKYKGNCKVAEEISETIINLPTHRNVSEIDAQKISFLINKCLQ